MQVCSMNKGIAFSGQVGRYKPAEKETTASVLKQICKLTPDDISPSNSCIETIYVANNVNRNVNTFTESCLYLRFQTSPDAKHELYTQPDFLKLSSDSKGQIYKIELKEKDINKLQSSCREIIYSVDRKDNPDKFIDALNHIEHIFDKKSCPAGTDIKKFFGRV